MVKSQTFPYSQAFLRLSGLTFSVPGDLHVRYIPAGSGAVDGARISGDERLTAEFTEADAPRFPREHFSKTYINGALERMSKNRFQRF